ncbi:MAG: nucleotidyltransferase family protein [Acidobacteriota bacterium]|nr:nucleotidyltransferase family protein [Acidobacteriota bacterium]
MKREELIPAERRRERMLLIDALSLRAVTIEEGIDADALLELAQEKLHPFLHSRFAQSGALEQLPRAAREKLASAYQRNRLMQLRRIADLKRIGTTLDAAGIPYLVLKGPVLAATVYPDAAARTMIDLDVLVPGEELVRAMHVLGDIGYSVPERFAGQQMEAGDAPPLVHRDGGSAVLELHSLLDSAPDDPEGLAKAWASRRDVAIGGGLAVPVLGAAEFFAHVVTHVSRHHRFEGELRSLLDVALLLRFETAAFEWERELAEWKRRGIDGWIALTVWLAHILLDAPLPEVFRERMPSRDALSMAADQLWATSHAPVPAALVFLLARTNRAPVHADAHASWKPLYAPAGVSGLRQRIARQWQRVQRFFAGLRKGSLHPRNIAREVSLFHKRERLFAMLEERSARDVGLDETDHRR